MTLEDKMEDKRRRTKNVLGLITVALALASLGGFSYWAGSKIEVANRYYRLAQERCGEFKGTFIHVDELKKTAYCCKERRTPENEKGEYEVFNHCKNISLK